MENKNKETNGYDMDKIKLAQQILYVEGDPCALTNECKRIVHRVISDIKANTIYLKRGYFGNKKYSGYYQSSDHPYSAGPNHGYIVDSVGLRKPFREKDLTDEEKEACIYYMTNYEKL